MGNSHIGEIEVSKKNTDPEKKVRGRWKGVRVHTHYNTQWGIKIKLFKHVTFQDFVTGSVRCCECRLQWEFNAYITVLRYIHEQ